MNVKKIMCYIVIICGLIIQAGLLAGLSVQSYRLDSYRKQCYEYRIELESARNRQSEITTSVNECIELSNRAAELLSQSSTSISQLKQQLSEARKIYEDMENVFLHISWSDSNGNNYTNYREEKLKND